MRKPFKIHTTTDNVSNVDNKFLSKANYDLKEQDQSVSTSVASLETRQIIVKQVNESEMYTTIDIPEQFRIDAKPFINRPFYVGEMTFDVASVKPSHFLLNCDFSQLPGDLIRSNLTLLNGLKMGSYYRSKCSLNISMAGTITHAGCVLVGVVPPLPYLLDYSVDQSKLINTILTGPHAFLNANEATSVMLPVPWYCNSDLATLDMDKASGYVPSCDITITNGNYATLVALVMNPLQPSDGSNASLNIVVEAIFENLDILVPTPRYVKWVPQSFFKDLGVGLLNSAAGAAKTFAGDAIDSARSVVKKWTGLHNPSTAALKEADLVTPCNRQNNIDSAQYFETLDPHSHLIMTVDTPAFNTLTDEMNMKYVVSKKQYLGTFRVNLDDSIGKLLFCRPISPYQGGGYSMANVLDPNSIVNNIELMHLLTRAWKGSIKITIQSVMNNKQQCKLRLIQLYNPSLSAASGFPVYRDVLQAPSHLMEFTAGGQYQEIVLPCLSRNSLVPCCRDSTAEGLFHGMYYIYVAQQLANSGGSPKDIFFNVYISLEDDFTFYGYSTEVSVTTGVAATKPVRFVAEGLDVMNPPQSQNDSVNVSSDVNMDTTRMAPVLHMRDLIRRMYNISDYKSELDLGGGAFDFITVPVSVFFNEKVTTGSFNDTSCTSKTVGAMFYAKHGGVKVRLSIHTRYRDSSSTYVPPALSIGYLPPNVYVSNSGGLVRASLVNQVVFAPDYPVNPCVPITFKCVSTVSQEGYSMYEFVLPYTSMYKYVGGPNKMAQSVTGSFDNLSTEDMGSLIIQVANKSDREVILFTQYQVGHTDETRLGFHVIAPFIERPVLENNTSELFTAYTGTFDNNYESPSIFPNAYMYFTRG